MDDATLVSRAVGGDRDAFAAIYDRYAGAVLDLCTAILRDGERSDEDAEEATLDSFLRAARESVNLRDRSRLRLWLLAVARFEATARAQGRRVAAPVPAEPSPNGDVAIGAPPEAPPVSPSEAEVEPDGPGRLAWDPAESLSEDDRAILHLHLRHQLDAEELGAVLGLKAAVAEARAARLRSRAETSVGALLLSRADGGADPYSCPGLSEVLDGWDGRFTTAVAARVDRHARRCDACDPRRTMLLERLRAMASLPFVTPPAWLRREVLLRMELAVSSRTRPGWSEDGFPPAIGATVARPPKRRRMVLAAAAAGLVLAVAGGGYLLLRDEGGGSTLTAAGSSISTVPKVSSTVAGPAVSATTVALTAPSVPTTQAVPAPTSTAAAPDPDLTPTAPAPAPTVAPVAADRDPPSISFIADAASAYTYGCPYSVTGVTADISDRSSVPWVVLFVRSPDGIESAVSMYPDGGRWRATMGDFGVPGQAVFWVEAADSEGNRSRAADQVLDVFACP